MGDIFFLSSKAEGLPNVVLEAIDAKCALLTTNVGGISDITEGLEEMNKQNLKVIEKLIIQLN